jgi:iron complex transport system ATP-binding protein
VAPGEWVGLIGANGAGKSSLLRAVAHLVPYEGSVRIDGAPAAALSRRQRAQLIAYVPQQPELPAGMSVFDYTLLGRTPHIGYFGVESADDRRHCEEVLDQLQLSAVADRHLATLSGGEVQRVVLARALSQDAPVLLLDEPTSALDLGRRVDALELVDELRRERGLTVLSAMHDLTLAAQFADRLVLLAAGGVVASGPPADVLREDLLTTSFGVHVRVVADEDGTLLVVPQRSHVRVR